MRRDILLSAFRVEWEKGWWINEVLKLEFMFHISWWSSTFCSTKELTATSEPILKIMGDFVGHAVPGTMFLLISIWWFLGVLLQTRRNSYIVARQGLLRSSNSVNEGVKPRSPPTVWYPCPCKALSKFPVEPIVKVLFAIIGTTGELFFDGSWVLVDRNGKFVHEHLNNHSHAVMYCLFGLSGVVDIAMWSGISIPLPPKFDFIMMSACFWIEGLLFYFHLQGHSDISVRLHTILYIVIFFTACTFFPEVFSTRHQSLLALMRAILLGIQGSWFLQIAFVLYGPNPWEDTRANVEFLVIAFAWHLFICITVAIVLFVSLHRLCGKIFVRKRHDRLQQALSDEEEEEAISLEPL